LGVHGKIISDFWRGRHFSASGLSDFWQINKPVGGKFQTGKLFFCYWIYYPNPSADNSKLEKDANYSTA
jgi:hypothetical protein